MSILEKDFKYIDLFAGIGGFHNAMKKFSAKSQCIMASEIDLDAQKIYELNFKLKPEGDIKEIDPKNLGKYDVVCGGFPCQTFSKAGYRQGFKDPRGTLFQEIVRLISYQNNILDRPKILLLENVRNLISHDNGDTWRTIRKSLEDVGYNVIDTPIVIGPKDIGVPQLRDRAIILAVRNDIYSKPIDLKLKRAKNNTTSIYKIIDEKITEEEVDKLKISDYEEKVLDCWNDFYHGIKEKIIGFPIWSDEFGKGYDISSFPVWKQNFILKNRNLYINNKTFIDKWFKKWKIREFAKPTDRKFEWQCGNDIQNVYDGIIQFRPSGIRVKKPTEAPTLVAMNHNPIIGKYKRRLSVKETARLQSFPDSFKFDESAAKAYKQLGNAVNVKVIEYVFKEFIKYLDKELEEK